MSQNSESSAARFFRVLTAICAVIGAVWVVVQISNYFFPADYKLEAYGDSVGVQWPVLTKDNQEKLKRLQEGISDEELKKIVPGLSDLDRNKLSESFKELARSNPPRDLINQFKEIRAIWWFTIRNVGRKEVTNAQLELPFDGLYVITQNNEGSELTPFKKTIPIASLRPTNSANVIVWTYDIEGSPNPSNLAVDDDLFNYNYIAKDTRVTHPNGMVGIEYPIRSRSLLVTIVTASLFHAILFLIVIMLFGVSVTWLLRVLLKRTARRTRTKNASEGAPPNTD